MGSTISSTRKEVDGDARGVTSTQQPTWAGRDWSDHPAGLRRRPTGPNGKLFFIEGSGFRGQRGKSAEEISRRITRR
eukprot:2070449-Heterocapsa_arctica.AAC.1